LNSGTAGNFTRPVNSMWWGHVDNSNLMLIGAGSQVWTTTTSAAGSLTQLTGYAGGNAEGVIFNPNVSASSEFFVADSDNGTIWTSANSGGSWTRRLSVPRASSVEFVGGANAILLGGQGQGVYFAKTSDLDTWFILRDASTPNADILDMDYDATDDVLVVGTLGRGAWKVSGVSTFINTVAVPASIDTDMIRILRSAMAATTFGGGTLQSPAATTAAANLTLNAGGMTFDANGFATTLSGILSGAGTLTKINTGTLTLTGANTYTGATTVTSGALNIQNNTALGTVAGGTTVASGAALELQGGITVGAEALTLTGRGISSGGALRNVSGNNSYAGAVTLASLSRINSDSGTLTLTGGVTNAGFLLSVGGAGNTLFDTAAIAGLGGFTKDGTGIATFNFANTYTGATTISAGTLRLGAADRINDTSVTTVASGGTFDLNGNNETLGSIAGAGAVTLGAGTLTEGGLNTSTTFSGSISGAGGLTKTGTGTLTLSGVNSYGGATAINVGVIRARASREIRGLAS
ncbi:MAG: autotransporter-associated beta strand repeat-containing protein, partial [Nitrospirota bacterium]